MTSERVTSPIPTITVRPSREEKARFAELAARLGVSESTLALNAIRLLLDSNRPTSDVLQPVPGRVPATDRITIRLRPGDADAILDRAARRGFKPSAYIAALVRAHLTHNPPLPTKEVLLLKQGMAVLLEIGRLLAHIHGEAAKKRILPPDLATQLSQTRKLVTGLEQVTHNLIRAALIAWESNMTRRAVRLPRDGEPMLDIFSLGRHGPSRHFTRHQILQISRTVRRVPEVMVKVTGGGGSPGAVEAHFGYISRKGDLEIETDHGERVAGKDAQKALLAEWHLALSAGQYRGARDRERKPRKIKLVYNIVLSMPSPTPPDKVLAGARRFAVENFGLQHRYAMVLHTDQQHPHVHMVVKAEGNDGQRLHVDKARLRQWREDFARMMREQGIAANASPRVARGRNHGKTRDARFRAQRHGRSNALLATVKEIAKELYETKTYRDPARPLLMETRRAVLEQWTTIAETLDAQGETVLATDVRRFAQQLPKVMTQKERLATQLVEHLRKTGRVAAPDHDRSHEHTR